MSRKPATMSDRRPLVRTYCISRLCFSCCCCFLRASARLYRFIPALVQIPWLCAGQQRSSDKLREGFIRRIERTGKSDRPTRALSPGAVERADAEDKEARQMAPIVPLTRQWPMSTCFHVSSTASIRHDPPPPLDGMSEASFGHSLSLARFIHRKTPLI